MKIADVKFYYLSMPEVRNIGDGSQDALLVQVIMDDGTTGFGECEAAPLVSIAAWCCPMSHSACKPLKSTVLGFEINSPDDIRSLTFQVRRNSFDLLQADHTLSGIDMALWDALGHKTGRPAWSLLGYEKAFAKTAYASQLFGDTPQETFAKARKARESGFRATKFGWGPFGQGDVKTDLEHLEAAREGLGDDLALMIDAGTVWHEDVEAARKCMEGLKKCRATWLEEPFHCGALRQYAEISGDGVPLAGGEGAHNPSLAIQMIDFGKVSFIQIDAGRIGGLTSAYEVACYARQKGVVYVNHTFTTYLALSASLQPFAGMESSFWCEYPVESTELARTLTTRPILPDGNGRIQLSDEPGLGMTVDFNAVRRFERHVDISIDGEQLWR